MVIGREMQLEPDALVQQKEKKNNCRPQSNATRMVYADQTVSPPIAREVLPEPKVRVFNFHTTGVVWST